MTTSKRLTIADRLAWLAVVLAAAASAAGLLFAGLYRDNQAMTAQAQGTDLATLLVAVPALAIGLWRARSGSLQARLIAMGALGYLVYAYAIFALQVIINPATPAFIAIVGLATWSLLLMLPSVGRAAESGVVARLPRRSTAAFFGFVIVAFGGLWLGEIAGAISSGVLPASVRDLELPIAAVYTLDLAYLLPAMGAVAVLLLRRSSTGPPAAVALLVFSVAMALSILGLFIFQARAGFEVEMSMLVGFGIVAALAGLLAGLGLRPDQAAVDRAGPIQSIGAASR